MPSDLDPLVDTLTKFCDTLDALGDAVRSSPLEITRAREISDLCHAVAYRAMWVQHAYLENGIRRGVPLQATLSYTNNALLAIHAASHHTAQYKDPL